MELTKLLELALAAITGAIAAIVGIVRWQNRINTNLVAIEARTLERLNAIDKHLIALPLEIEERIRKSRHDIMELLHKTVTIPMEKLENEVVQQGKHLAILTDRYTRDNQNKAI